MVSSRDPFKWLLVTSQPRDQSKGHDWGNIWQICYPPETNSKFAPKNGWLEYEPFLSYWGNGFGLFSGAFFFFGGGSKVATLMKNDHLGHPRIQKLVKLDPGIPKVVVLFVREGMRIPRFVRARPKPPTFKRPKNPWVFHLMQKIYGCFPKILVPQNGWWK